MKDILITGGAGKIGYDLVLKLASSDYSITVLDLESKESIKKLSLVKDNIKIIYGDVEDYHLIQDLVKKNDIVIDYAGIMPPLANLNESIANSTNYGGCKNIVDAIKEVNPQCLYIYMSFISIYGESSNNVTKLSLDGKTNNPDDFYSVSIIRSEEYIKSNLKKYIIFRMPIVLTRNNYYVKHIKLDRVFDFITSSDLNDLVIKSLKCTKLYGKSFNISGFKANSKVLIKNMYKVSGKLHLTSRTLYYGEYEDSDSINKYVDIKYTSLNEFLKTIKAKTNPVKRNFRKTINFIKYLIFSNGIKK